MKTRLETIDVDLAQRIKSLSHAAAKSHVGTMLTEIRSRLPDDVSAHLSSKDLTGSPDLQDEIDRLDGLAFDLEAAGEVGRSDTAFRAARFLSAVLLLRTTSSSADLCDAAYEAMFAAGGPP